MSYTGRLTFEQEEVLWEKAGGPLGAARDAAAIAGAESGGDPNRINPSDPLTNVAGGPTQSAYGLWQMANGTHSPPLVNWADPAANAAAAVAKYKAAGNSFAQDWGSFTSGAYLNYEPGTPNQIALDAQAKTNPYNGPLPKLDWADRIAQLLGAETPTGASNPNSATNNAVAPVVQGAQNASNTWVSQIQQWATSYWTQHPLWLVLAGIVLLVIAWGSLGGPTYTAQIAGSAAGAAAKG